MHPETDHPLRFAPGSVVHTADGTHLTVGRSQTSNSSLLVRFEGVVDRTGAEGLGGEHLYIPADARRSLDDDEFWPDDLVGLRVVSTDGLDLGVVESVVEGVGQHRLTIAGARGRFDVPFVVDLVPDVDLGEGVVRVDLLPGLLPEG